MDAGQLQPKVKKMERLFLTVAVAVLASSAARGGCRENGARYNQIWRDKQSLQDQYDQTQDVAKLCDLDRKIVALQKRSLDMIQQDRGCFRWTQHGSSKEAEIGKLSKNMEERISWTNKNCK